MKTTMTWIQLVSAIVLVHALDGLTPRDDDTLDVNPLAPDDWEYFALDDVPYRGHRVGNVKNTPEEPLGSQWNEARFDPVKASKVRIVFTHRGRSRSGVSEVLIWNE